MPPKKFRILIADNNAHDRANLIKMVIQQVDMNVIGSLSKGWQAFELALEVPPDVCVLDIFLENDGMEVITALRARLPQTRLIVWSNHVANEEFTHYLARGVHACLPKSQPGEELLAAIRDEHPSNISGIN